MLVSSPHRTVLGKKEQNLPLIFIKFKKKEKKNQTCGFWVIDQASFDCFDLQLQKVLGLLKFQWNLLNSLYNLIKVTEFIIDLFFEEEKCTVLSIMG